MIKLFLLMAIYWYMPLIILFILVAAAYFYGGTILIAMWVSVLISVVAALCRMILGGMNVQ